MSANKGHIISLKNSVRLLTIALLGFCQQSYAQSTDSIPYMDSEFLQKRLYLQSTNPIAWELWETSKLSELSLNYHKENGDLRNYFHSDDSYAYGANIQSTGRYDKNTVFHGQVNYSHFKGKNMGGSNFIDPYIMPFDIVDFTEDTEGTKGLELYNLQGGISHKLKQGWLLGGKIDYTTGNYTKFKDLRHVNKLLDMDLSVGSGKQIGNTTVGLNYIHHRRIESINHVIEGNNEGMYTSFINYGNFFGYRTTVTRYGTYVSLGSNTPLADLSHGLAAQLYVRLSPDLLWSNELQYHTGSGYYGDKDRVHYSKHETAQYAYAGELWYRQQQNSYLLTLDASINRLTNFENVLREYTPEPGITHIEIIAQKEVFNRQTILAKAGLNAMLGAYSPTLPQWTLSLEGAYIQRNQTATLFPNYRQQTLHITNIATSAKRNYRVRNKLYQIKYSFAIDGGNGDKYEDGTLSSTNTSTDVAFSFDKFLNQEYEYLTATKFGNSIDLTYQTHIRSFKPFVRLQYSNQFTSKPIFIGKSRNTFTIGMGTHL